jgi:hypothetical protein
MEVVLGRVVEARRKRWEARIRPLAVALRAERVALGSQLQAVGIVAIAAADAGPNHPALQKRAIDVDLAPDLAVGVVERRVEQRG